MVAMITDAIFIDDLCFSYSNERRRVLNHVSYSQAEGEFVVILGRNGAGKSTFLRCINRVIPNFYKGELKGDIFLFGKRLTKERVRDLVGIVGTVFQDFEAQLFSTNVMEEMIFGLENLGLDGEEMMERIERALCYVGLKGFEGRDPATLSGGEKQRLVIASILAMEPRLILLDEPTSDLDPLGRKEVLKILYGLKQKGHSFILADHDIEGMAEFDRIMILDEGRFEGGGTSQWIFLNPELLERRGIRPLSLSKLFKSLNIEKVATEVEVTFDCLRKLGIKPSQERYKKLIEEDKAEAYGEVLIKVEGLEFSYPGNAFSLKDINLVIREGEFIALLGHNGSGKTTLAKHFNGLLRPSKGKIYYRGENIKDKDITYLAKEIGYVFQNPDDQIFAPTVLDEVCFGLRNLGFSKSEIMHRAGEVLSIVSLEGYEHRDPFSLTKGERQRLAVASVLAVKPKVLILDEPTTGLDYLGQKKMMDLVEDLNKMGHTIIIITHSLRVAVTYAHRAILMHHGRILYDARIRDLFGKESLLREASFSLPEITRLGKKYQMTLLSEEEFLYCIEDKNAHLHIFR